MKPVTTDPDRIAAFAEHLRSSADADEFDFCSLDEGFIYPERGRPGVLEMFFFACAHQFGFWLLDSDRWNRPMVATLDGKPLKGSDYLWRACTRAWQANPDAFAPAVLHEMTNEQLEDLFRDDEGQNPLPMWKQHLELIRGYAGWFDQEKTTPERLLAQINEASYPLHALLQILAKIPGYAEDPLQKKAMLLAIVLENRPEHFMRVTDHESAVPIIDYHLQRSALRTGLVRVTDNKLHEKLVARTLLTKDEEEAVRSATHEAIRQIMAQSGLSAAAVDWFFFQNRIRCPETCQPNCPHCPVESICARETDLFQPVFRTTSY